MSDYKSISTANLPDPAIDPAAGKEPSDHFATVLWTGDGTSDRSITTGHAPDFVWTKERNSAINHIAQNSISGSGKYLHPNTSAAEQSASTLITSFDSNGFTVGNSGSINGSSDTYVAWSWKAGGTTVSNTDGSITSSVSANTEAGMSLVGFTGTGANATVGHGLDQKPEMFWIKNRDRSAQWSVYHKELGATKFVELSTNAAAATDTPTFNDTEPTATVFSVGTGNGTNADGEDLIAFCFHSVDGYSKVGHYVGNGSSDGPFIYAGFRVAWLMIKRTDSAHNWYMFDNARTTTNPQGLNIMANDSAAEDGPNNIPLDFLSNGFKPRGTGASQNASGGTYIYMAFAENPFKYSNAR